MSRFNQTDSQASFQESVKEKLKEEVSKAWGEYRAGHTNWCGSMLKLREEFRQDILTSNMYWTETLVVRRWVSEIIEELPMD
jgi:hypothetical protein